MESTSLVLRPTLFERAASKGIHSALLSGEEDRQLDGMHHKSHCGDIEKACRARGVPIWAAISAEQGKCLKHHRGFGGTPWVYLKSTRDADRAAEAIATLAGVLRVLT